MEWQADKWPNFTERELQCKETGECEMDVSFMNRLQGLRRDFNQAMIVTSGYRSPEHSAEKGIALQSILPKRRKRPALALIRRVMQWTSGAQAARIGFD